MGMNIFARSCTSCTPTSGNAPAPNPNPGRFNILSAEQVGWHVVVRIHYLDCTNFEGIKICVYRNASCRLIESMKFIDPHFSEHGLSPFARFEPTPDGYNAAIMLAKSLN